MTDKPTGEPAFPSQDGEGMTLRDYFAGHCPIGMLEAWAVWTKRPYNLLAKESERAGFFPFWSKLRHEYADAMIAERDK